MIVRECFLRRSHSLRPASANALDTLRQYPRAARRGQTPGRGENGTSAMNAHQKIDLPPFPRTPTSKPVAAATRAELLKDPGFGRVFTDHMVTIRWTKDRGWHDAQVCAREPISLDPAAAVLHYRSEIFEGLKAYTRGDGR